MNTKRAPSVTRRAPLTKPQRHGADTAGTSSRVATTTSTRTQRVYIDLPVESVRRFNVLAAMRSMPKRKLLEAIVEDALKAANV